jgi:outer membrane protein assembly factor BamB
LAPEDGAVLWRYKFLYRVCAAISPVVAGNSVFCSAGYGTGAGVCEVSNNSGKFSTQEIWRLRHNEPVANYWNTPVGKDGYLYGMFGFKKFNTAPMKCVDVKTGEVKWAKPGFGHGNVILLNNLVLAMTGYGELALVDPSPDGYRELARAKVLSGKCWSTPIFSGGRLYARSTKEAVCLELSPTPPISAPLNAASNQK